MISREQAGILAQLVRTIRPSWDQLATMNAIGRHQDKPLAVLAHGVLFIAANEANRTPSSLGFEENWPKTVTTTATPGPPKSNEACPVHGGWKHNCPGCRADRLVGAGPDLTKESA